MLFSMLKRSCDGVANVKHYTNNVLLNNNCNAFATPEQSSIKPFFVQFNVTNSPRDVSFKTNEKCFAKDLWLAVRRGLCRNQKRFEFCQLNLYAVAFSAQANRKTLKRFSENVIWKSNSFSHGQLLKLNYSFSFEALPCRTLYLEIKQLLGCVTCIN